MEIYERRCVSVEREGVSFFEESGENYNSYITDSIYLSFCHPTTFYT
jgi:hypothetical protein